MTADTARRRQLWSKMHDDWSLIRYNRPRFVSNGVPSMIFDSTESPPRCHECGRYSLLTYISATDIVGRSGLLMVSKVYQRMPFLIPTGFNLQTPDPHEKHTIHCLIQYVRLLLARISRHCIYCLLSTFNVIIWLALILASAGQPSVREEVGIHIRGAKALMDVMQTNFKQTRPTGGPMTDVLDFCQRMIHACHDEAFITMIQQVAELAEALTRFKSPRQSLTAHISDFDDPTRMRLNFGAHTDLRKQDNLAYDLGGMSPQGTSYRVWTINN